MVIAVSHAKRKRSCCYVVDSSSWFARNHLENRSFEDFRRLLFVRNLDEFGFICGSWIIFENFIYLFILNCKSSSWFARNHLENRSFEDFRRLLFVRDLDEFGFICGRIGLFLEILFIYLF